MNLANKPGLYNNFSGEINWRCTNCQVRNADFEILKRSDENMKEIIFDDAVFVSGKVGWCVVKNGLNLGCDFYYCDIEYMINKGGEIFDCDWRDGIFEDGIFYYSTWYDGIWIKGKWDVKSNRNSKKEKMEFPPDQWEEN